MKSWDAVIIGGGIIGISLALSLRKHGAEVLVVERGAPGREASHASAGMLAYSEPGLPEPLLSLALASARLYPEFVHEIEDESGMKADFRRQGTIAFLAEDDEPGVSPAPPRLTVEDVAKLEPSLATAAGARPAPLLLPDESVDARALLAAALKACKHRGVEIAQGAPATGIEVHEGRAVSVLSTKTRFPAAAVVNCAGAWAGEVPPLALPTRPVKGQMLAVAAPGLLRHAVRAPGVYLVPRSDGRVLIGATVEEAGFDKRVEAEALHQLHQAAANLAPDIGQARILESWAGLRPGTPDALPILGATAIRGYFVATGHYRNGILLAPITARLMTQAVRGAQPDFDITPFSPARFAS